MYNPVKPSKVRVLKLIKKTWASPYLKITSGVYATFRKKFDFEEIDHTDGIGTKGFYHWNKKSFKYAVIDALAMNLNDLAMVGAIPYKLQNHIVLPKDDTLSVIEIIESLVKECIKRKIVITGGETSIQDTSKGMDLSITVSGIIKKIKINKFQQGDVLIGLASSGLHSNGLTKVREVFKKEIRDEFVVPTKIYSDQLLNLYKKYDLHGLMHITGGAYSKLRDIIDNNMDVLISNTHKLKPQPIFYELNKKGVSDLEMYKTFNCGIGFIFSVDQNSVKEVLKDIKGQVIGKVVHGTGKIIIESMFSGEKVFL